MSAIVIPKDSKIYKAQLYLSADDYLFVQHQRTKVNAGGDDLVKRCVRS